MEIQNIDLLGVSRMFRDYELVESYRKLRYLRKY